MPPFDLHGYTVRRLTAADAPRLQVLYERCTDYHLEHEGTPTRPTAAEEELAALPPGRLLDDKVSVGIHAPGGEMVGYLDLMRDYPLPGEWWISLLMIDPELRGSGLGKRIYEAAAEWVASRGAHTISLGVLEHATRAEAFWRRVGFQEATRLPYASETGARESRMIVMRQPLPPAAA